MIQPISGLNTRVFKGLNAGNKNQSRLKNYADSFIDNSVQSTPMLLALTTVWSLLDKKATKLPLTKTFAHNFSHFFLPVMLVSSTILSIMQNANKGEKKE